MSKATELLHDLLKCKICLEQRMEQKALPCQDTLCLECLQQLKILSNRLRCPVCNKVCNAIRHMVTEGILKGCNAVYRIGMEWVRGSDLGVGVFAPQYPARKDRVPRQLWYLPTSKKILVDLKLMLKIMLKMLKNYVAIENFML